MSQATQPCRHSTGDHSQHGSARHATEHGCERFRNVSELRCWHVLPTWPPLPVSWQGQGKSQTQLTAQDRRKAESRTRGAWLRECWAHWPRPGPRKHRCRIQRMAKPPQQPWGARLDTGPCLDGPQRGTLYAATLSASPAPPQPGGCQGVEAPRKDRLQPEGDPTSPKALRSG